MSSHEAELPEAQSNAIAHAVREALARRRISRQKLADDARISISTLEKALSGRRPFTLATTIRIEEALGLSLRGGLAEEPTASRHAPEEFGAYSHEAVAWLEGRYLTLRPSFGAADAIFAYRTEILWDAESSRLTTLQSGRGSQLAPVAAPIAYVPEPSLKSAMPYGRITDGMPGYELCRTILRRVADDGYASFFAGPI